MRPPGFEPGSSAWQGDTINWPKFKQWLLKDHSKRVARDLFNYAEKFQGCLLKRDLKEVRDLRDSLRPNVMKALSALSKFLGMYEEYKALVKSHGLKWGGRSADDIIIDRLTKVEDPGEVFKWILEVKRVRPDLTDFMDFIALSGLRFNESIWSYNLIIELSREGKLCDYYDEEMGTLEHFKFKEIFIRRSKKAFISFVPASMIKKICENEALKSVDSVQKLVQKRGLKLRFGDIREAHATFMTKYLKQPEIDFLHGRVSANVFMSNYFNPALIADLKTRVFQGIEEIQGKIT